MIRDALKSREYFDRWLEHYIQEIAHRQEHLKEKFSREEIRPQYTYELAWTHFLVAAHRFSRGDSVSSLSEMFPPLIKHWQEAERLGDGVWTPEQRHARHSWAVNLDHYINCFWVVGLALALDIPDQEWTQLVSLIGNEGEDCLLDRIIATRQVGRKIGATLCYPKPYGRLLSAIDSQATKQPAALVDFVEHWYQELPYAIRTGREKQAVQQKEPHWYQYHLLEGGYFGFWCFEAIAAVKAFSLDDSSCVGHPHYPGDILRPGLTTESDALRLPKGLQTSSTFPPPPAPGTPEHISAWEALKRVVVNRFKS